MPSVRWLAIESANAFGRDKSFLAIPSDNDASASSSAQSLGEEGPYEAMACLEEAVACWHGQVFRLRAPERSHDEAGSDDASTALERGTLQSKKGLSGDLALSGESYQADKGCVLW